MTRELETTFAASGIEWPALRNHISCMAYVIQFALGTVMSSLGVKGCTKSWEAHEHNQQFGEIKRTDIGKSHRLRKEGNARINNVSAMRPGFAKTIEKVRIVLAVGPGNPPAVRIRTAKTVWFSSKPVRKPNPLHRGWPNPDPYPSTRGFGQIWLDPSDPISSSGFWICLFIVAFRYPIANRKILTLVYCCPFVMY
jgi:hypothetical protein